MSTVGYWVMFFASYFVEPLGLGHAAFVTLLTAAAFRLRRTRGVGAYFLAVAIVWLLFSLLAAGVTKDFDVASLSAVIAGVVVIHAGVLAALAMRGARTMTLVAVSVGLFLLEIIPVLFGVLVSCRTACI